jgi:hypothetical protein
MFDSLMKPLGKEHCLVFYIFGLLSLLSALIYLVRGFLSVLDKKNQNMFFEYVWRALMSFFIYYLYRINYSICSNALN